MGRLSELHIGAVGVGAMLFNFIYWNFGFLRMGTTGLTAQAFGQQNAEEMAQTLGRAVLMALGIAALLWLLQIPLGELGILLMHVEDAQAELVASYFYTRIWAAPATLLSYVVLGWFFGMQNAIYPLILTVVINVVNIIANFVFVLHFGMDVQGVALGTVVAQYVGLLLAIVLFFTKYKHLTAHFHWKTMLAWAQFKRFLAINRDIFIRTICLTFAFGFFYSQSSAGGEMLLAVNVILLQFLNWMSYGVDGFAFASESLVGKYAGKKDASKTRRAIRLSFAWGMGLALLFSFAYGAFGNSLLFVFTNQADVIAAAQPYMFWMVLFPILGTPCYIWDGVFIGLTASKAMRNSMLLAFGMYVLAYFAFAESLPAHGLWLALSLFLLARGGFQQILYWRKGLALQ